MSLCATMDRFGLLRVGAAMAVARGVSILTGIGLAVLLASTLGAEGYGTYIFALTLAYMLSMPVLMGLPTLLMRQVAVYRSRQDRARLAGIVRWSVGFVTLTLMALAVLASGYLLLRDDTVANVAGTTRLYMFSLLLVSILAFMHIAAAVLRGFERVLWGTLPDGVIRPVLLLGLVFALGHFVDLTPSLAIAMHVVAALAALAWAGVMVSRHCRFDPADAVDAAPRFEARTWLASLLPLSLVAGAAVINSKIDFFMLGVLSTHENVGNYSLALQIAGLALVAQAIVNAMVGPRIARMHASGDGVELQRLTTYACRLSSLGALACVAAILGFGDAVVRTLVGSGFADAPGIAAIIAFGLLFSALMGPNALILNMTGHERITARIVLCSAPVNAALNIALIPTFGAYGAAVATVTTVVLTQSTQAYFVRKRMGLDSTVMGLPLRGPVPGLVPEPWRAHAVPRE